MEKSDPMGVAGASSCGRLPPAAKAAAESFRPSVSVSGKKLKSITSSFSSTVSFVSALSLPGALPASLLLAVLWKTRTPSLTAPLIFLQLALYSPYL